MLTENNLRNILNLQKIILSEHSVHLIIKASQRLNNPSQIVILTEARERLKAIKTTALRLADMLKEWYPYLEIEPEDKTLSTLECLISNCDKSLKYYKKEKSNGGAPLRLMPLKLFAQILILIYEEETGSLYEMKAATPYGRERTSYNPQLIRFAKSILKEAAPGENIVEALKLARRDPLPLDWTRKMKGNLDEYFRDERSHDKRRGVALKKKLVNKGFQLI